MVDPTVMITVILSFFIFFWILISLSRKPDQQLHQSALELADLRLAELDQTILEKKAILEEKHTAFILEKQKMMQQLKAEIECCKKFG